MRKSFAGRLNASLILAAFEGRLVFNSRACLRQLQASTIYQSLYSVPSREFLPCDLL